MIDLERSLAELADRLEIRGGDRLVTDVVRRISQPMPRRQPRRRVGLAVALAALLMIAIAGLPGPRHAIARWFGFDSVRIEPDVTVPTTAVPTTAAPTTASSVELSAGSPTTTTSLAEPDLGLGAAVSLADAVTQTALPDPMPGLLGEPLSIHVVHLPRFAQIVIVYPPSNLLGRSPVTGVGALVSVFPAQIDDGLFGKALGTTATVRSVDVDGSNRSGGAESLAEQTIVDL
ncbi:MAG TPA: hypothetical protein VHN36_16775, partial [Ilumatobacteraceae bacterium]|nr:hypothetical protein [Ilumatobacteraceae bacterium]